MNKNKMLIDIIVKAMGALEDYTLSDKEAADMAYDILDKGLSEALNE